MGSLLSWCHSIPIVLVPTCGSHQCHGSNYRCSLPDQPQKVVTKVLGVAFLFKENCSHLEPAFMEMLKFVHKCWTMAGILSNF